MCSQSGEHECIHCQFLAQEIESIYIELDIEALEKARRPMAEEEETESGFGKGHRKGGARHFSKPYVDSGLLFTVLEQNQQILQDLKNYELT